jgi:CBS domain containing-hemolysin-like protein
MPEYPLHIFSPVLAQGGLAVSGLNIPLSIVVLVVSVLGYALVNSIEIAVVAANRIRVRHLAEEGSRMAQSLERLQAGQDRFFAFIVLFQNLFVVVASAMGSVIAVEVAGGLGLLVAAIILTVFIALVGEVTPKALATQFTERYALLVAAPVEWCMTAMRPLVSAMAAAPRLLGRLLFGSEARVTPTVTEAELRMLIDISTEEGAVAESTGELLERVFHFRDRLVKEMMIPRTELVWLEKGTPLRDFYQTFAGALHSRFPVYDESIDNVVGIVGIKDVLRALAQDELDESSPVDRVLRPALYVPETKPVGGLFWEMQEGGHQMAIVVDEYGGTAGIVTMEMLLEEMVGRMVDELGRPEREFVAIDEHTMDLDAGMSIHDANEDLELAIPDGDYETVAGFVLSVLGHIPREGEQVQGDGFRMVVAEVQGVKIERVRVTRV